MFGISTHDQQLLMQIIDDLFDIAINKRNRCRMQGAKFKSKEMEKIAALIQKRATQMIETKNKEMFISGMINMTLAKMKRGIFTNEKIAVDHKFHSSFLDSFNIMTTTVDSALQQMISTLETYARADFTRSVSASGYEAEFAALIDGINNLGKEMSQMLSNSLQNGMDLQNDANTLKMAVESLSTASNQQAASLEETAAAMEEMTSNVQQNSQKANDMASMAAQTDASAKEGAELAHRTASAMTEIQEATNSINSAVAIIENIAFQTNILSLNAAVEAATAGEAGKGFAVVAQEVRNLANRSADAAKEIKALAQQAAGKSDEGMQIANDLTRGFEDIASKIEQTTMLVQDVSNASREQMQGIGQINTAITQLDQMTQETAKVAAEADNIANATISKAIAMVDDASSKNFIGKEKISLASHTPKAPIRPAIRASVKPAYTAPKPPVKHESDDIWESF